MTTVVAKVKRRARCVPTVVRNAEGLAASIWGAFRGPRGFMLTRTGGYLIIVAVILAAAIGALVIVDTGTFASPGLGLTLVAAAFSCGGIGCAAVATGGLGTLSGLAWRAGLWILSLGLLAGGTSIVVLGNPDYVRGGKVMGIILLWMICGWFSAIGALVTAIALLRTDGAPRGAGGLFVAGLIIILLTVSSTNQGTPESARGQVAFLATLGISLVLAAALTLAYQAIRLPQRARSDV